MTRGPKKHMKRLAAPSHWNLAKMKGIYAPRPSCGPHKLRECLPLMILLRNRLRYALTYDEAKMIAMQRLIKIDGKVRTDIKFPIGFMDVVTIEKTHENARLLYDTKGRFVPHKVHPDEALYKLCKIRKVFLGPKGVPTAVTHDGRTLRYIHPDIKTSDVVRIDLATGKVLDFIKFAVGNKIMVTGGHNIGRVGAVVSREKHPGSTEIVHIKDARGQTFATRESNVFTIGTDTKFWVTLPKGNGIKKTVIEDREQRLGKRVAQPIDAEMAV